MTSTLMPKFKKLAKVLQDICDDTSFNEDNFSDDIEYQLFEDILHVKDSLDSYQIFENN